VRDSEELALRRRLLEQLHRLRQLAVSAQITLLRRRVTERHPRDTMLELARMAADELAREDGIECRVVNNHTVKPMDEAAISACARECGAIVTVEEHQVHGGMGSRVAEIVAQTQPVPIEFVGVHDRFGQSGDPVELIEYYGMGTSAIKEAVRKARARKG